MPQSQADNFRTSTTGFDGDDPSWAIAATQPRSQATPQIDEPTTEATFASDEFFPEAPESLRDSGLTDSQIEALVTKFLLNTGASTGREIASQIALPFAVTERQLVHMKLAQLIVIKSDAMFGDYSYELTEAGVERARLYANQSTYFGAAPVPLHEYVESVEAQSLSGQKVTLNGVQKALDGFVVNLKLLRRLGEALNMGRGMFLHGDPGNGKSSLAEAIIHAYGETIWIPRAVIVNGEIVRLYDPIRHDEAPLPENSQRREQVDNRWVRIKRPAITVGGELSLDDLDISTNRTTGINEASIQMKCNCGVLIFDDFGRNRFRPEELLNRLIVPLERQTDALSVSSGRTFQVPFDCMVVFATNLDPANLMDEAFLRRIPFTIPINNPDEQEFRAVFRNVANSLELEFSEENVDHLLNRHYKEAGREMRYCHPIDILRQIHNACDFQDEPPAVTNDRIDTAVENLLSLRSDQMTASQGVDT